MKRSRFISNMSCFGAWTVVAPTNLFFPLNNTRDIEIKDKDSIRLIRNATLVIQYAGMKFLLDPLLAEKGAYNPFAGGERNPTVGLPASVEEIIENIDLVLVSHTHSDHFDAVARGVLVPEIKLINQPADEEYFRKAGFSNAETLNEHILWNGINIYRTGGKHGTGDLGKRMGNVSGFVLKADDHPTIYIIGDSIWTDEVKEAIDQYKPDYIVANTGGARFPGHEDNPILMDEDQTILLLNASGIAKVIAVHMESLDHCQTTRSSLEESVSHLNIQKDKLIIPRDGEVIILQE
jgi:L-ascorbate metabolism protein UlaG (beta-lactamase superfamily)